MTDSFFTQNKCDRCGGGLQVRMMSWFNADTICMECANKERAIKTELKLQGKDPRDYEGCGYIPKVAEVTA